MNFSPEDKEYNRVNRICVFYSCDRAILKPPVDGRDAFYLVVIAVALNMFLKSHDNSKGETHGTTANVSQGCNPVTSYLSPDDLFPVLSLQNTVAIYEYWKLKPDIYFKYVQEIPIITMNYKSSFFLNQRPLEKWKVWQWIITTTESSFDDCVIQISNSALKRSVWHVTQRKVE